VFVDFYFDFRQNKVENVLTINWHKSIVQCVLKLNPAVGVKYRNRHARIDYQVVDNVFREFQLFRMISIIQRKLFGMHDFDVIRGVRVMFINRTYDVINWTVIDFVHGVFGIRRLNLGIAVVFSVCFCAWCVIVIAFVVYEGLTCLLVFFVFLGPIDRLVVIFEFFMWQDPIGDFQIIFQVLFKHTDGYLLVLTDYVGFEVAIVATRVFVDVMAKDAFAPFDLPVGLRINCTLFHFVKQVAEVLARHLLEQSQVCIRIAIAVLRAVVRRTFVTWFQQETMETRLDFVPCHVESLIVIRVDDL
jgi:hypothetical protein